MRLLVVFFVGKFIIMITRKDKEQTVSELKEKLGKTSFVAFLNFHGMSVAKVTELRRSLRREGSEYMVAKKTLVGVAAKDTGISFDQKKLEGEVALVFGGPTEDSALGSAKAIMQFAKKNAEIIKVIGGVWNKEWADAARIKQLSMIPTREVLLTQLAFILTQPMAAFARALQEVSKKGQTN